MTRRQKRWAGAPPQTEDDARVLLLRAAERCFERLGVARTTVDDIASEAGVHRTTVYKYFAGRDAVLVGVLLRESEVVIAEAERCLAGNGPFVDRMCRAYERVAVGIRQAKHLSMLFAPEAAGITVRVAEASTDFKRRAERAVAPYVAAAIEIGELRADIEVDDIVTWLVRVSFMLVAELSERIPDARGVDAMRRFVLPALVAPAAVRT